MFLKLKLNNTFFPAASLVLVPGKWSWSIKSELSSSQQRMEKRYSYFRLKEKKKITAEKCFENGLTVVNKEQPTQSIWTNNELHNAVTMKCYLPLFSFTVYLELVIFLVSPSILLYLLILKTKCFIMNRETFNCTE